MSNALLSIQIIPKIKGGEDVIPYVDEAIKVIADSGVDFEVHPMETTMEGELSELLDIVKKLNERMIEIGCSGAISQVKISYKPEGIKMSDLTRKYR
ncbi:thiamine-binding protein [Metabacillus fastidiosus]|uniref:thiamine-binding protein n=1 Tax=Metabacillus fastidiosus TaxID=1458 RepID=UPI003D2AAE62